jgi:hypothetical protein
VWLFLSVSKEPPLEQASSFLVVYGLATGGLIRCDQGGELAKSSAFITHMQKDFGYTVEPTGADSPSQNGCAEIWNNTLANTVRVLLYGAGLPAKYWSAAILHAVYLHNRCVHQQTKKTPFELWTGMKPDLCHLKIF